MKAFIRFVLVISILVPASSAFAASFPNMLDLEQRIAAQQGQFGGLYARCASFEEKAVIGGSLAAWRKETFEGYQGSTEERAAVEKAFDNAADTVKANTNACEDWIRQAAAAWNNAMHLSQYGVMATASR